MSTKTKKIVLVAFIIAINVGLRLLLSFAPQIKAVAAISIISGTILGGVYGFIIGSMTMLISSLYFGLGIWTIFQMLGMGIISLLAGIFFKKDFKFKFIVLAIYGFLSIIIIYGGLVNYSSYIMMNNKLFDFKKLLVVYSSGFIFDLEHAIATFIFIVVLYKPLSSLIKKYLC